MPGDRSNLVPLPVAGVEVVHDGGFVRLESGDEYVFAVVEHGYGANRQRVVHLRIADAEDFDPPLVEFTPREWHAFLEAGRRAYEAGLR